MGIFWLISIGFVAFIIIRNIKDKSDFDRSDYSKASGKDYKSVIDDKGDNGERLTYQVLENLTGFGRLLTNVYIPKGDGTTEIDIIYIHRTGIYVIESKNYSGTIYGKVADNKWTQVLENNKKNSFYNPIMQNETHMKYLKELLSDLSPDYFESVVVFSKRCILKVESGDVRVVNRDFLGQVMNKYIKQRGPRIEIMEIERLYQFLLPYTKVDEAVKEEHIKNIKKSTKKQKKS